MLRQMWHLSGADIIASAVAIMVQKVQATSYVLEGPDATVEYVQSMIDMADLGAGWMTFLAKVVTDFLTTDNGAFVEFIGDWIYDDDLTIDNLLGFAHLDSLQCERTANLDFPVRYYSTRGSTHRMPYDRVHMITDLPAPAEMLYNYGYCALSRAVSTAQYSIQWTEMRTENMDALPPLAINVLNNVNKDEFKKQMMEYEQEGLNLDQYVMRSVMYLVQQDSTKPVSVEQIPMRQLWESFDEQKAFDVCVNMVAMAFGLDRQELAPLATSAMGSGEQSTILDLKSRGKGIGNILAHIEQMMRRLLPKAVRFEFDYQDDEQDLMQSQIKASKVSTVMSLYQPTPAANPLDPFGGSGFSAPSTEPSGVLDRDEVRKILMYEVPEWGDLLDPTNSDRDEIVIDDLEPSLKMLQTECFGATVRYKSSERKTYLVVPAERRVKAKQVAVAEITEDEIVRAREQLSEMGIQWEREHAES